MARYEIRPKHMVLVDGQTVGPSDVIATVECNLAVRDVLGLLQFGGASLCGDDVEVAVEDGDIEPGHTPDSAQVQKTRKRRTKT